MCHAAYNLAAWILVSLHSQYSRKAFSTISLFGLFTAYNLAALIFGELPFIFNPELREEHFHTDTLYIFNFLASAESL